MILKMAFRNIFRHKKRTVLTLITIIFGIFVSIVGDGLNSGVKWQLADVYINTMTSSLKIYPKGYYNPDEIKNQVEYGFQDNKEIDSLIQNMSFVKAYSKRFTFEGKITDGADELNAKFIGIDLEQEEKVFNRSSMMISGKYFPNKEEEKIIIGKDLADALKIKTGDIVTIFARSKNRTLNAYDTEVNGIIRTGNPLVDMNSVFMPIKFSQKLGDADEINDIAVLLNNKNSKFIEKKVLTIQKSIDKFNIEAIPWFEEGKDLLGLIEFRERVFGIITAVILIMAAAGITNTMLMAMLERKREIGIMSANGMKRNEILKLFLAEGAFLGLIGSGIALIAGYLIVSYFQVKGITIPISKEQIGTDFPIEDKFYMYFNIYKAFTSFFIGVLVSLFSSFYPALKAVKLEPVEAIKQ